MLETPPAPRPEAAPPPALLEALAREASTYPTARKILLCRRIGEGREVLRALAAAGAGWIGFEPMTPRVLAQQIVAARLAELGRTSTDEFDELALLDDAVDAVLERGGGSRMQDLAEGAGFRQAIGKAVAALRLAGIDAETLGRVRLRDPEKRDALVGILEAYEQALESKRLVDEAGLLRMAFQALSAGAAELPAARLLILPAHDRRGLAGRLLELLLEKGAVLLPSEAIAGLGLPTARLRSDRAVATEPRTWLAWLHDVSGYTQRSTHEDVTLELFAAASIPDELREVLRRVVAAGLRWDEVEIVATEPFAYGAALDALAQRLDADQDGGRSGVPVTYAVGLPIERTRPGRALRGYLRWIQEDFPANVMRGLLERGDIAPPGGDGRHEGAALARALRRMRIGRGRERYAGALRQAERAAARPPSSDDERDAEEVARARAVARTQVSALAAVLLPILEATPELPDRLGLQEIKVSPAALARGARAFLELVPCSAPIDVEARKRLLKRLSRLEATAIRPTTLDAAIAVLGSRLDTRVPAADADGKAPWTAAGGRLHFSDIESGGNTGRRATFIIGLDAARFPGYGLQDPLLVDDDRHRLNTGQAVGALPTTGERIAERRYALAELLARLRGHVTLSYSAWDAAEARTLPPASEMLQAFRLRQRDPDADYERLHGALGEVASAVPRLAGRLDAADVWLAALDDDGVMRDGRSAVEAAFDDLGRGVRARDVATARSFGPHQGSIVARPICDPRGNPEVVVSPTRLERLGACPRRYFLHDVLRIHPPDDPELEPDRWLSARDRGSLLHTVFERALQHVHDTGIGLHDDAFLEGALLVLDEEMAAWRDRLPPAGEAVYAVEAEALRDDVRAFVRIVRRDGPEWVALERTFGRGGEAPVSVRLPGGTIRLAGAIDRIDRAPEGGLVVIDYKTGSTYGYQRNTGIYRGGRRLQHVLYAAVAQQLYGEAVVRAEYHFPTVKGGADRASYSAEELHAGLEVVDRLLGIAARGHFHATDDPDDCRFCDYAAVCRVRTEGSRTVSPPASWSGEAKDVEELSTLRSLREDR